MSQLQTRLGERSVRMRASGSRYHKAGSRFDQLPSTASCKHPLPVLDFRGAVIWQPSRLSSSDAGFVQPQPNAYFLILALRTLACCSYRRISNVPCSWTVFESTVQRCSVRADMLSSPKASLKCLQSWHSPPLVPQKSEPATHLLMCWSSFVGDTPVFDLTLLGHRLPRPREHDPKQMQSPVQV